MDQNSLNQFKARRDLWIDCLTGNDRHSIKYQIHRMLLNAATFRVINEARRIAPPAKEGGVQLNGMMHRLITDGFFAVQLFSIRCLTDTSSLESYTRERDVISLISLLDDMRKHASLMTRVSMFAAEGLEYDVDRIADRFKEYVQERPRELESNHLEERHAHINFLAGVSAERHAPDDGVGPVVMERLKEKVTYATKDLRVYVNKFLAHAATPGSRQVVEADNLRITLNRLYQAHKAICKVANFVSIYILGESSIGGLAHPIYDQFAYIDKPLVTAHGIAALRKVWDEYDKETHQWANWGIQEFQEELQRVV
jgi:hypothetical protein